MSDKKEQALKCSVGWEAFMTYASTAILFMGHWWMQLIAGLDATQKLYQANMASGNGLWHLYFMGLHVLGAWFLLSL